MKSALPGKKKYTIGTMNAFRHAKTVKLISKESARNEQ
jgi:hypothetical protein